MQEVGAGAVPWWHPKPAAGTKVTAGTREHRDIPNMSQLRGTDEVVEDHKPVSSPTELKPTREELLPHPDRLLATEGPCHWGGFSPRRDPVPQRPECSALLSGTPGGGVKGTMPGGRYTFYTSCQASPHGLNDPDARSAQPVLHVQQCTCQPCLQPVPPGRGDSRDGTARMQH